MGPIRLRSRTNDSSIPRAFGLRRVVFVVAACAGLLGFGEPAEALTIQLCECVLSSPDFNLGGELTLGFRIEGDPGEQVYGLGLSVHGYNESVVDFVTGRAVPSIFHGVAIPGIGAFNGLENTVPTPVVESAIGASGNRVMVFNGVGLSARTFNALDPGLDGVVGGGDAQIRVTFRATGPGVSSLVVDTRYDGDGVVGPRGQLYHSNTIQLSLIPGFAPICPVPEPGTALLILFGLGVLARHRRS